MQYFGRRISGTACNGETNVTTDTFRFGHVPLLYFLSFLWGAACLVAVMSTDIIFGNWIVPA